MKKQEIIEVLEKFKTNYGEYSFTFIPSDKFEDIADALTQGGEELIKLIADLREIFPFPPEKDYDNGYDINKKDGWCVSNIVSDPKLCLEMMINNCPSLHPQPKEVKVSEDEIDLIAFTIMMNKTNGDQLGENGPNGEMISYELDITTTAKELAKAITALLNK